MPRYVLILVDRYPPPNDKFYLKWGTWARGRYIYSGTKECLRVVEADADDDQQAAAIARAYDIDNCGGIPMHERPMAILTMYRVEEVPVDGLAVQAAFIEEIDAATRARTEAREREQLARLKAKYEGK